MKHLLVVAPLLALALPLFGCARGEGSVLVVKAPGRLASGVASDDAALCGRLAVDFTFDNLGDAQPPLLDAEPLVPVAGEPCTFELASIAEGSDERSFPRGNYDALVRFLAKDDAYTGFDSCAADDVAPLWIGAYVIDGLAFPDEALRFSDDAFLSRPGEESGVPVTGVSFDVDGDERDNLAEVAAQSDPCVENTPPLITLSVEPSAANEEEPVTVRVTSSDPAGVRHRVTLRLAHEHGPAVGTEVITYRRHTSAPAGESLSPDPANGLTGEGWDLVVTDAVEEGSGAVDVSLRFLPNEPFVGPVHVTATADDGFGNLLATAAPVVLDVTDVDDPTSLLFEDDEGALVPLARVDFREVGPGTTPTVRRFKIANEDLDQDVSQWSVALAPGSPAGLTLEQDLSFWRLEWSPDNDDVLNAPEGGHVMFLQFKDASGADVGPPEPYPLGIAPLYNNAPSFGDLSGLDLTLNAGPFQTKVLSFTLHDPDEATGQPSCAVEVDPVGATPCTTAWSELRCEVNGARSGDTWPFVVTLTPSASYFDDCGSTPQFELRLSLSDVAPAGADPAEPRTVATQDSCASGDAGCVEHLQLYTAETVSLSTVSGGAAAPSVLDDLVELSIDGVRKVAVVMGSDELGGFTGRRIYVVDLATTPPSFVHAVPRTTLCAFHEGYLVVPQSVAVDEVNGRIVGFGGAGVAPDDCYDTSRVVFSLSTLPPYDVVTWPLTEACASACSYFGCGGAPAADAAGNVYLPCGGDNGTLLRIDGDNQLSTRDVAGYDMDQDAWGTDVVEAPDGKSWFAWPDAGGIHFVDLSTWDDVSLRSERLPQPVVPPDPPLDPPPPDWFAYWLEQGRADPWRQNYLYAYDTDKDGVDLELFRVTFDTGSPVLDGPLDVGDHGTSNSGDRWVRFLLKPVVAGQPASEPDLVVTGQVLDENRLHVDLDSFTVVPGREPADYYYLREVFESPDARFYVGWVSSTTAGYEGLKLFPWDATLPFEVQQIPGTADWSQPYMRNWSVSHVAGLATMTDSDGVIRVLRFESGP